jgi:hypothetical protein
MNDRLRIWDGLLRYDFETILLQQDKELKVRRLSLESELAL